MTASTAENSSTRRRVREALIDFSLSLPLGWLIAMTQGSASREADRGAARYGLRMTRAARKGRKISRWRAGCRARARRWRCRRRAGSRRVGGGDQEAGAVAAGVAV